MSKYKLFCDEAEIATFNRLIDAFIYIQACDNTEVKNNTWAYRIERLDNIACEDMSCKKFKER